MRGVVALAAAISLPETLGDGRPFAQRNLIVFLTFCVILVTLVVQGLSLPSLIRALGLAGGDEEESEEVEARRNVLQAAITYLEGSRERDGGEFRISTRIFCTGITIDWRRWIWGARLKVRGHQARC